MKLFFFCQQKVVIVAGGWETLEYRPITFMKVTHTLSISWGFRKLIMKIARISDHQTNDHLILILMLSYERVFIPSRPKCIP